jgi:hypothetical protein
VIPSGRTVNVRNEGDGSRGQHDRVLDYGRTDDGESDSVVVKQSWAEEPEGKAARTIRVRRRRGRGSDYCRHHGERTAPKSWWRADCELSMAVQHDIWPYGPRRSNRPIRWTSRRCGCWSGWPSGETYRSRKRCDELFVPRRESRRVRTMRSRHSIGGRAQDCGRRATYAPWGPPPILNIPSCRPSECLPIASSMRSTVGGMSVEVRTSRKARSAR